MKINTLLSPSNAEELFFTNKRTIVIDILRATTTIVTALNNGAKEIIPVNSIEFAMKVSGNSFGGHTLLGGERNSVKIDGFALGNSPLEYTKEIVEGKSIVLFTTNGSGAIVKAKFSKELLIASFLNAGRIAEYINKVGKDVEILCAGNNGRFSFEDSLCAGKIISEIEEQNDNLELNDGSKMCAILFKKNRKKIKKTMKESDHGKKLIEKGFKDDITFASKENIIDVIPVYDKGVVVLKK